MSLGVPRCRDCFQKSFELHLGRCPDCYHDLINTVGELSLLVDVLGRDGPEKYVYEDPGVVYAHFYRLEDHEGFYLVKREEREWCMRLDYIHGYPCPPRLCFVNKLNYLDDNPLWWPKTTFKTDPLRKLLDLPDLDDRSTTRLNDTDNQIPLHNWTPNHYVELIAPQIIGSTNSTYGDTHYN